MSDSIRLAVVGCGVIGRLHAEVIARHPDLSLTGVVDIDLTRAQAVAEMARDIEGAGAGQGTAVSGTAVSGTPVSGTPGPYVTDSLADLLGRDDVDAVAVAVPSGRHADISVQVLATGRHLVVEKPLEVTVARARLIADAAAAAPAGTLATVISQHRFDPASVAVHDAVARGALGRLTSAVATVPWWRSQGYYDSGDWRGTWALDGGGSLMNQGIHTVDLLLWLLGTPVDVIARTARLAHERVEVEDTVAAVLRFESGALATLHATTAARPGLTVRIQLMGDGGSTVLDNDRLFYFHSAGQESGAPGVDRGIGGGGNQAASLVPRAEAGQVVGGGPGTGSMLAGHTRQYDDVVRAIRTGTAPGVTVADALAAVATVQSVYEAARTGQAVRVADVLDGTVVPRPVPATPAPQPRALS